VSPNLTHLSPPLSEGKLGGERKESQAELTFDSNRNRALSLPDEYIQLRAAQLLTVLIS